MADSTVFAKPFNVASPIPWISSSVSMRVKTQFFQGLPTIYVVTSVIFMRSSQFRATMFSVHEAAGWQIDYIGSLRQRVNLARRCTVPNPGCNTEFRRPLPRLRSSSRLLLAEEELRPSAFAVRHRL